MKESDLEEHFHNMHLLDRSDRVDLTNSLNKLRPEFLREFSPKWWWWPRCKANVLIVTDKFLNFGTGGFGLSEFLTTFNALENASSIDYRVTLAHRSGITQNQNPVVVNHISDFRFDSSVDLNGFEQIWLFGVEWDYTLNKDELKLLTAFMDQGGGVFATGDHENLGQSMCGKIPRIKDMRYWDNFPTADIPTNQVSQQGKRRNDTNTPRPGDAIAHTFAHQADAYPQTIAVRTFGQGMPHPLLSISRNKRASGIIDIMPDHPHEGECKPETVFTVNGSDIPSQIIATSFVNGGNTSGSKAETEPHCFSSIAVWDGHRANAGRIVIDSTWHHFVNINLLGLDDQDFDVIQQYYMNIATWMPKRGIWLCWLKAELWTLFKDTQLVEAALDDPSKKSSDLTLSELGSIGALAEELLGDKYGSSIARDLLIGAASESSNVWANISTGWKPESEGDRIAFLASKLNFVDHEKILHVAVGKGFIQMRDDKRLNADEPKEKSLNRVIKVFAKGADQGTNDALESLFRSASSIQNLK